MSTIPQNDELLKNLFELIGNQEAIAEQKRVYERVELLLLSELFVFGRHTVTQLLTSLGLNEQDWSAWYRLFSEEQFKYEKASAGLLRESLQYVKADAVYVVAVDATQTPRSSRRMEGAGWLRNMRTPLFMVGIHAAQRWFNGSWLIPAENGYRRAVPLRWMPAFTEKSQPKQLPRSRNGKPVSTSWDGSKRNLCNMGEQNKRFCLWVVVRGKQRKNKYGKIYRRQPLPFLGNAVQGANSNWVLPLPLERLLFWAWQRWEVEVCHRELKTTFGLGHKQCFNPHAAVLSVQWSAWVYSLLLLAGCKTFGLARAPDVPTRWWRGSGRWSFATLLRSFRATLWGKHDFRPIKV